MASDPDGRKKKTVWSPGGAPSGSLPLCSRRRVDVPRIRRQYPHLLEDRVSSFQVPKPADRTAVLRTRVGRRRQLCRAPGCRAYAGVSMWGTGRRHGYASVAMAPERSVSREPFTDLMTRQGRDQISPLRPSACGRNDRQKASPIREHNKSVTATPPAAFYKGQEAAWAAPLRQGRPGKKRCLRRTGRYNRASATVAGCMVPENA
jgi:hypothetical protein